MKRAEITQTAKAKGIQHLSFSEKRKTIKAMSPYFYRGQGGTLEALKEKVLKAFPTAEIVGDGDNFVPFKGGAPVSKQSHIYVEFKIAE